MFRRWENINLSIIQAGGLFLTRRSVDATPNQGYFGCLFLVMIFFYSCNNKKLREEIPQDDAMYYYNEGVSCDNRGEHENALYYYNKAIEIDSTKSDFFLNRGIVKEIVNKDTTGALYDFIKAAQLDSLDAVIYYNIGCLVSDKGNDSLAIEYYSLCQRIDPEYYPVYHNLAMSQYALKDYHSALSNFEISSMYNYNAIPYDYYYMGLIYKEIKEHNKAKEYFERAAAMEYKDAERELLKYK